MSNSVSTLSESRMRKICASGLMSGMWKPHVTASASMGIEDGVVLLGTLCLIVYPSFVLTYNTHWIIRVLILSIEAVVLLLMYCLMRRFLVGWCPNRGRGQTLSRWDFWLPLLPAVCLLVLHEPYRQAGLAQEGDEQAHFVFGTFGLPALFLNHRTWIVSFLILVLSASMTRSVRRWIARFLMGRITLLIGTGLGLVFIVFLEWIRLNPEHAARHIEHLPYLVYRFPALGKYFSSIVYTVVGINFWTLRLPAQIADALLVFPVFWLGRALGAGPLAAIALSVAVLSSPLMNYYGGILYLESLWLGSALMSLLFLAWAVKGRHGQGRGSDLLWFILWAQASFFVRNPTLLLPLALFTAWLGWWAVQKWRSFSSDGVLSHRFPLAFVLAWLPMLIWHMIYIWYGHRGGAGVRAYEFTPSALIDVDYLLAYGHAFVIGFGPVMTGFSLLALAAAAWRLRNDAVAWMLQATFWGFLLLMLGEGGWPGYGRFLYLPLLGLIPLWAFLVAMGDQAAVWLRCAMLLLLLLASGRHLMQVPWHAAEVHAVTVYHPEKFLDPKDFKVLVSDIRSGGGQESALWGASPATDLLKFSYRLTGQPLRLQLSPKQITLEDAFDEVTAIPGITSFWVTENRHRPDAARMHPAWRLQGLFHGEQGWEIRRYLRMSPPEG